MAESILPRNFDEWRQLPIDRDEDAAYSFGYHLIVNCRDEAMASIPADATPETSAITEHAIDLALHNLCGMLEGFWKLNSGAKHSIELILGIRVHDQEDRVVETVEISPDKLDLQIGYWKWAQDREFR